MRVALLQTNVVILRFTLSLLLSSPLPPILSHLDSGDTRVDALDDLLGDADGIDESRVQPVAELQASGL